jgi:hypothetical protein
MVQTDPAAVSNELLQALLNCANHANTATDARDLQAAADAALKLSQALVLIDPELDPQGVPLSHHTALEEMRGQQALEQARARSAAPSPAKRSSNGGS